MNRNRRWFALPLGSCLGTVMFSAALFVALLGSPTAADDDNEPGSATDVFAISRGGLLYDKWWDVLLVDPPETTHPAYPEDGKKEGSTTWRCKECHGWDYRGADGAYGQGSHYTGIGGVRGMVGVDPTVISEIIRNDLHAYTQDMLSDRAVEYLARFISVGQVDMDQYIDRETKVARGDVVRGARFYQTICAVCHGFDGRDINFHDADDPEYIGTIAQDNPWEALHKIRNGQPGVPMVAMSALGIQDQVDILAYTQTLPAE